MFQQSLPNARNPEISARHWWWRWPIGGRHLQCDRWWWRPVEGTTIRWWRWRRTDITSGNKMKDHGPHRKGPQKKKMIVEKQVGAAQNVWAREDGFTIEHMIPNF